MILKEYATRFFGFFGFGRFPPPVLWFELSALTTIFQADGVSAFNLVRSVGGILPTSLSPTPLEPSTHHCRPVVGVVRTCVLVW